MKIDSSISCNVPTLVDGGVCGSVDSATSYKRVLYSRLYMYIKTHFYIHIKKIHIQKP